MRLGRAIVVLTVFLAVRSPAALGQEEAPAGQGSEEVCQVGELCGSGDAEERFGDSGGEVQDPAGRHVRSLVTLGLMAAFIGSYLFMALTGRSLFRPRLGGSRRGNGAQA